MRDTGLLVVTGGSAPSLRVPGKHLRDPAGQKDLQLEEPWEGLVLTYETQTDPSPQKSVEREKRAAVPWGSCRRTGVGGSLLWGAKTPQAGGWEGDGRGTGWEAGSAPGWAVPPA